MINSHHNSLLLTICDRKVWKYWQLGSVMLVIFWLSIIPIRLTRAWQQVPEPQAILTLGGGIGREKAAAKLAQDYPHLEIWVSSGSLLPKEAYSLFQEFGIAEHRLHLDRRATDTVTNFTTLVNELEQSNIKHVYLVTSDFHLPRATAIATIVLGSRGIAFTPVAITSDHPPESTLKILRDSGRSLFWILTGHTGASLKQRI